MQTIARPSIQSLFLEMRYNGKPTATGTGFVYSIGSEHFLVTNRHNVTGLHQETNQQLSPTKPTPNEVMVLHNRKNSLGKWLQRVEPIRDANEVPLWTEHPMYGAKVDCVALRLTQLDDVDLFPYNEYDASPNIAIGPADAVSVVGFPFGIKAGGACAVWATGFVASEPSLDYLDLPLMLIDCRGRPGQSGSPVIAYRNGGSLSLEGGDTAIYSGPVTRSIGIYSGRVNDQSDLGLVWKMEAVRDIVRAAMGNLGSSVFYTE